MSRTFPAFAVAALSGLVASMVGGFLIASWTIAGIAPAYIASPRLDRASPRVIAASDGWREAGYARIGLWRGERDLGR